MSEKLPDLLTVQASPAALPRSAFAIHSRIIGCVLSNTFVVLAGAYGIILTVFLILRWLAGERWTFMALFNSFLHLILIPPLVLLPLCLLLRRWRLALTQTPAVVIFLLSYGALFISPSIRATQVLPDIRQLHVMTYNLKSQEEGLGEVIAILRGADADLVALQELSEAAASTLSAEFATEYPYQALHPQPGEPVPGQGFLSRYPILSDDYWRIHLGHQRVTLDIEATEIVVYNPHPIQPLVRDGFARRAQEITDLLDRAVAETSPLLLLGDFNMSDQSEDYRRVTAQYTDTWREAGWGLGFTFPADATFISALPPVVRIDYIFHDSTFQGIEARVWPTSGGSDHRPLFARLALIP